ncbi:MAG: 3-deoxy-D-manno-octulosonic acid transferase [Gammaproteobacteria bacterium]|nr:3-deoxy-D-manno-octulosonic acid transferase [Gammaproteobacteria bacterium]
MSTERLPYDLWRYNWLLRLLALPITLYTLWQALKEREPGYLWQRLGIYRKPARRRVMWLHAASVGEVNAVLPLIKQLQQHQPEQPLLLTTATPSGARAARAKLPPGVGHAYFPIDWRRSVRGFLAAYRPRCALIMETELWPNLYCECAQREVPLLLINGRLSARTSRVRPWLRRLYTLCLQQVTAVLARSEQDRASFITLGAPRERCEVIGNIKFSSAPRSERVTPTDLGRPYVLAASTRNGEEGLVMEAWRQATADDHLLVIAPRHPQRREQILAALKGEEVAVRSRQDALTAKTSVYLADTFGELPGLIAGAELVFMGGSLVAKGGQNILEAAALGRAPLFGPHMENFRTESETLLDGGGAIQVEDGTELAKKIAMLLADAPLREQMGERARLLVDERRDMASRYREAISRYCE